MIPNAMHLEDWTHYYAVVDAPPIARAAMTLEIPHMDCRNCRHWHDGCDKSSYWKCFGLFGEPAVYPPVGWEP